MDFSLFPTSEIHLLDRDSASGGGAPFSGGSLNPLTGLSQAGPEDSGPSSMEALADPNESSGSPDRGLDLELDLAGVQADPGEEHPGGGEGSAGGIHPDPQVDEGIFEEHVQGKRPARQDPLGRLSQIQCRFSFPFPSAGRLAQCGKPDVRPRPPARPGQ